MKRTFKIGAVLTAVGLLMVLFGFANRGFRSVIWQNGFRVDSQKSHTRSMGKISKIELATNQPVTITSGNVSETKFITNEKEIQAQNDDGILKVHGNVGDHSEVHFLFGSYHNQDGVTIVVPKATKLSLIEADRHQTDDVDLRDLQVVQLKLSQSGATAIKNVITRQKVQVSIDDDLWISNSKAASVDLKSSDGNIVLDKLQVADSTKVNATDGDIAVKNSQFKTATVTAADGDVVLKQNQVGGLFKVDASDGDIDARIQHSDGVQATALNGTLEVNGHNQHHSYHQAKTVDGHYQLRTQDGDMTIHR